MKIFIDSAEIDEIKQTYTWGVTDGITTNPSLLKRAVDHRIANGEKIDIKKYLETILLTAKGTPVSLEVTERKAAKMIEQGRRLYDMFNRVAKNVYIKIPVNPSFSEEEDIHFDGIEAIRALTQKGIPVNCTLIFTPEQALLAAKAGAKLLSPFAGRVDDSLRKKMNIDFDKSDYYPEGGMVRNDAIVDDNGIVSGIDLVRKCVQIVAHYGLGSEVLAASLRNPRQVREAALAGAHIGTLPFAVIRDMLKHEKTYEGMKTFTRDIVQEYADLK
jgi:transaldolase